MNSSSVPWRDFEARARELAGAGQRLLEDAPGVPGVAYLATVGSDTTPRIHPFIPAVVAGELCAFVIESPKQRDLERTGRFAIHSRLAANDESFSCAGRSLRIDAHDQRATAARHMPYTDIDEHHLLYQFHLSRALWTTWKTPTSPVYRTWNHDHPHASRTET
jgi:hypothetical protein